MPTDVNTADMFMGHGNGLFHWIERGIKGNTEANVWGQMIVSEYSFEMLAYLSLTNDFNLLRSS